MRMKRRILSIFMSLVLILSTVMVGSPASVAEAKSKDKMVGKTFVSGQYRYKVVSVKKQSGTVTMTGAKSQSITDITMPATVKKDGYTFKVTAIANNAFKGYKKLKSVTTNTELKTIGNNAFNGCGKLNDINIATTKLTSVGKNALKGISATAVIEVPGSKISSYQKLLKGSGQKSTVVIQSDEKIDSTQQNVTTEEAKEEKNENNIADAIQTDNIDSTDDIADAIKENQTTETTPTEGVTEVASTERSTEVASTERATETASTERSTETASTERSTETASTERSTEAASTERSTETASTEQTTEEIPPEQGAEPEVPQHTHSYTDWGVTIPATCVATGIESRICTVCGQEETRTLPKEEHAFSGWVETRKANCVEAGLEKRMCDECGLTQSRQIAMLAHNLQYTHTTAATCTSGGKEYSECTVCKQVFFHFVSSALGHDFEETFTVDKEPTCNPGSKSRHCSRLGCDAKTDVTVVPAEHKWGDYVVDWEGCTSTGRQHRTCTVCKTTESVTTEPKGHVDDGKFVCEQEATCTEAGIERKRCSRCNAILGSNVIPAKGHDFSVEVSTDVSKGLETKQCSRCDEQQTQVIHKAGHIYADEFTEDLAPGCNFGIKSRHCMIEGCDAYTDWTPIPGTGHNFDEQGHCTNEGCESVPDIIGFQHRFVWGVAFMADMDDCEGFVDDHGNRVASICKTTIIDIDREGGKPDGKIIGQIFNTIQMTAPEAKAGYKFVGWQEVTANGVGELNPNPTCTIDWKSMGKVYKAVYAPINGQ